MSREPGRLTELGYHRYKVSEQPIIERNGRLVKGTWVSPYGEIMTYRQALKDAGLGTPESLAHQARSARESDNERERERRESRRRADEFYNSLNHPLKNTILASYAIRNEVSSEVVLNDERFRELMRIVDEPRRKGDRTQQLSKVQALRELFDDGLEDIDLDEFISP